MKVLIPFIFILGLSGTAYLGKIFGFQYLIAVVLPYSSLVIFTFGILYRIIQWIIIPVPFRIPTVTGQQKSLPWIKNQKFESPHNNFGVAARMAGEILFFRSLFRNTGFEMKDNTVYGSNKWLWFGALVFHWSLLFIVIRHFRFFTEPVMGVIGFFQSVDNLFHIGTPGILLTNILIIAAIIYLILRRIIVSRIRYISLGGDYFVLFLILAVIATGVGMRHFFRVDLLEVKIFAMGLASFQPVLPQGAGAVFYIHLSLVSVLLAVIPFSKIIHCVGVFFSPTRNMANNSRMKRHVNPWNSDVAVHTYEEWEEEFKDKLEKAGIEIEDKQ